MADQENSSLLKRIADLEAEVREREQDLAHFRSELAQSNAKLEKIIGILNGELDRARLIQQSLVPTQFPHIPGLEFSTKFVPSLEVGGDYFDIFEHEDKFCFGVIVSSCNGHKLSSLFLSLLLKMTGQLEAKKGMDPVALMEKLLDQAKNQIVENESGDLFYGVLDRRKFQMNYVLVGNVILFHQSVQTDELSLIKTRNPSFAKDYHGPLSGDVITLNAKDRLIICTPGVLEVRSRAGESFGIDRLYKTILNQAKAGVHDLRNEILYQLEKFSEKPSFSRDVTVLVLEVKERVIKLARSQ